jgi:hypothetical protein
MLVCCDRENRAQCSQKVLHHWVRTIFSLLETKPMLTQRRSAGAKVPRPVQSNVARARAASGKKKTTQKTTSNKMPRLSATLQKIKESFDHLDTADRSVLRDTATALAGSTEEKKKIIRRGVKRSLKKVGVSNRSHLTKRPLTPYIRFSMNPENRDKAKKLIEKRGEVATFGAIAKQLAKMRMPPKPSPPRE